MALLMESTRKPHRSARYAPPDSHKVGCPTDRPTRPPFPLILQRIDFTGYEFGRHPSVHVITQNYRKRHPLAIGPPGNVLALDYLKPDIPKPPGEPGRPRVGGYSLELALEDHGWKTEDIKGFLNDVRSEMQAKLDTSVTYRCQNPQVVREICALLSGPDKWPVLADYVGCWPVVSALKIQLKYSALSSRRKSNRRAREDAVYEDRKDEDEVAALLLDLSGDASTQS